MYKLKGILAKSGIVSKLFLLIGTSYFFAILGVLFWTIFTNQDLNDITTLKSMQFIQAVGVFILPPLVVAYFWSEKPFVFLHLDKKNNAQDVVYVILFMVFIIPFVNLVGDLNQQLVLPKALEGIENWMKTSEETARILTEKLLNVQNTQGLILNIILIAMLPALGEELIFRGVLQRIFQEWKGAVFAIWVAAFVFSAIHLQFYGFVPRLLMGAFFGYLLFWSENLWLPILAHFTNNALAVIFYYLKTNGYQTFDIDAVGTGDTIWLGIASGALGIFGLLFLKRHLQQRF